MGQSEQFAEFVAARQAQLLRLTMTLTGNQAAAEVLAQAALARLWPRWGRVSSRGDPWRYLLDLSVEETADVLDCSAGTVKSQTAKALPKLRGIAQLGLDATVGEGSDS